MGYPRAKSLLCVANIAKSPAKPRWCGLVINNASMATTANTAVLEIVIPSRKNQFTWLNCNITMLRNNKAGRQNFPTNTPIPLPCDAEIRFARPAM